MKINKIQVQTDRLEAELYGIYNNGGEVKFIVPSIMRPIPGASSHPSHEVTWYWIIYQEGED